MGIQLPFDEPTIRRYSRQILLREVGGAGQQKLAAATVAVVGGGAAADVCALYLGAAGVRVVRAGSAETAEADLALRPAPAADPAEAWLAGAHAAVQGIKLLLGVGAPASERLFIP